MLYVFRAISCSSSGGQIVLIQHLVSSLSVSDRPVHRFIKTNLLTLYEAKIVVCSEIQTKHINAMLTPCRIFEC